ncbi:MAG: GNAT family N-acetyltransferase [Anaerofustis stercorihominis]|nr:GNAT family N-acetyltransferase [Anaerofustis stercorihominis]
MISDVKIVNDISIDDFLSLRDSAGFQSLTPQQAELVLNNTTYICAAVYDGKVIGFTRLLFDFCTDAYLTDVIVYPEFQGKGVGSLLIEKNIEFVKNSPLKGIRATVILYANPGKEPFYERFGFENLPHGKYGNGMLVTL